jgi:hypothetical protein
MGNLMTRFRGILPTTKAPKEMSLQRMGKGVYRPRLGIFFVCFKGARPMLDDWHAETQLKTIVMNLQG